MGVRRLKKHPHIPENSPDKPVLVIVLDGWGEAPDDEFNAVSRAETPFMDSLKKDAPDRWRTVSAHGKWVGLNETDMGNSEVHSSQVNALWRGSLQFHVGVVPWSAESAVDADWSV